MGVMKILLLARHFPPAVSGGARRPYLWAKGLMENGADVFVVAPDIPEDIAGQTVSHPFRDPPTGLPGQKTLRDYARDLLLWPDPDIRWTKRAIATAKAECPFDPDWIITTSPPESIHAAGKALLAHWPDAKWAIDARDHWLVRPFRKQRLNPLRKRIEQVFARRMLSPARAIFAVNDLIRDEFAGYAPKALAESLPHFVARPPEPFAFEGPGPHLVHTGSFKMSDPDVSIEPLLAAFVAVAVQRPDLRLHLAGRLRDDEQAAVTASPARDQIMMHGIVPLETSLAMQAGADALIVCAAPEAPVPPGKLNEYRAAGVPITPIGPGAWRQQVDDDPRSDRERIEAVTPLGARGAPTGVLFEDQAMAGVLETLKTL
jgi:glycosyltransferase involved in cell wall biosynthesis